MIIIKDFDKLKNLTKNELNVLLELLKISDQEENIFFHNNERETISQNLDINRNSLSKFLLSLEKNKKLITKKDDYYYKLNKNIFSNFNL